MTAGAGQYPFMVITIAENVQTYLVSLLQGSHTLPVTVTSTCGIAEKLSPAPMLVLDPIHLGTFAYSGEVRSILSVAPRAGCRSTPPIRSLWPGFLLA